MSEFRCPPGKTQAEKNRLEYRKTKKHAIHDANGGGTGDEERYSAEDEGAEGGWHRVFRHLLRQFCRINIVEGPPATPLEPAAPLKPAASLAP